MGKDSYALATGLFMATLIISIVVIVNWLGDDQRQTQTYVATTRDSVTGLKTGSTVYYRGIDVGKVSAVRFDTNNPSMIVVPIEVDNTVRLNRGVYATLEYQGVTGLTQIALKDSGDNPEPLPSGGSPDTRIPIKPSLIDRLSVAGEDTVKETHELVLRLNQLLDKNNIQQMKQILTNIEAATSQFSALQNSADKALTQVPALTADARHALSEVNELTGEFKQLSQQIRQELTVLSRQSGDLMQTGASVGQQLLQTTMPRANTLMLQMQATIHRFDRVATMLETDPQAFLLGAEPLSPGPGEPGFKASQ
ncbi:MlaD family protein [Nitrosospira sp. Nsp13]|uniref:MlaD family protein n=1 Tax=Nitrosospira sp. Nsp13 TaxID=1855332 RepID=UPI00088DE8C1|nr:MlaD family protein [Nitrosospira sp. Nsp13]SCY05243.1 phospholipid/cholesterol/gamma-HCH transport system substrate-binding protein [Nitrosospira sp. Nsp13]